MNYLNLVAPERATERFETLIAEAETEARVRQAQRSAGTSAAKQTGFLSRVMSLLSLATK